MKSKFLKNIISGFGGQLIIIVLGLIVPRLIIKSYGSDINGLMSTITQIFTYMALLEAGIGSAAKNSIFKYINENNKLKINEVLSSAEQYYRKLSYLYVCGVAILSIILPLIVKSDENYLTIFLITFFEGGSGVISFYFIQTPTILLSADGKNYINNNITLLNKIIGYIAKIVMASFGINIVLLQIVYFLISVVKAIFYRIYLKKNYKWLNLKIKSDFKLPDRNSYLISEITWTIFSSTDMIVLSMFMSTKLASVYGIYNMIFTNINVLLTAVYNSITYKLGQEYHHNLEHYKQLHDLFNTVFIGIMTILMSMSYVLCIPFVSLYTSGLNDVNYIINELPLLFCLVQLLSWSRYVGGNLIGVAGRQKQAVPVNITEAALNLFLSIILVNKYGIIGVLVATVVALPIKLLYCNYVSDKLILKRTMSNTYKIIGVNFMLFFIVVIVSNQFQLSILNFGELFIYGICLSFGIALISLILNAISNPNLLKLFKYFNR